MTTPEDLQCLKAVALMGGCKGPVWASSQTLAEALDTSPQTASRRLISLEGQGLIARTIRPEGQYISVTRAGEGELRRECADYFRIFGRDKGSYTLDGVVVDGLGEGRYYVMVPGYLRQFRELLGFDPFPGTLNVRLNPASVQVRKRLDALAWINIEGFTAEGRTFGKARCLPCTVEGQPGAIVVPGRSHYPEDVVEILSPLQLKKALNITARDRVHVEVGHD